MKIRTGLMITLVTIFLVVMGCSSSDEQSSISTDSKKVTKIDLAHAVSDESAYQKFAEKFKEIVEEETNNELKIEIHSNGALGGERELVEGIEMGTLDAAIVSTGPIGNFTELTKIMDFPFLFTDSAHAHRVLDGEIGEEMSESLSERDIQIMAWLEGGFANTTNSVRPIEGPEDFKGLTIRAQENDIHIDTFEAFGANPTPMAFTEVFTALQQGVIDGQTNMLATIVPSKLYESQKYYSHNEIYYIAAPFIMNSNILDGFSNEHREIVEKAAIEARDYEREFVAQMEQEYLQTIKDAGLEVLMQDELEMEQFIEKAEVVYEKYESDFGQYFEIIRDLIE